MDLGTGGGLPGLVLAGAFPSVSWTLVDARAKKISQVAAFTSALGLTNVTTVHARAEDLGRNREAREGYDGVISRAVGPLLTTVALARVFVSTGEIIAIRGPGALTDARNLMSVASRLDVTLDGVERIDGTIRPTWLVRARGRGPVPNDFSRTQHALLRPTRGGSSDGSA
jgi:16S rRNA G527 N7-methylase RsmG